MLTEFAPPWPLHMACTCACTKHHVYICTLLTPSHPVPCTILHVTESYNQNLWIVFNSFWFSDHRLVHTKCRKLLWQTTTPMPSYDHANIGIQSNHAIILWSHILSTTLCVTRKHFEPTCIINKPTRLDEILSSSVRKTIPRATLIQVRVRGCLSAVRLCQIPRATTLRNFQRNNKTDQVAISKLVG